jgi:hypothetical protein
MNSSQFPKHFAELLEQSASDENGTSQKAVSFNQLMVGGGKGGGLHPYSYSHFQALKSQLPRRLFNFLSPGIFFRAHSAESPPNSKIRVLVETVKEFISLKSAFSRNRINLQKYDEDGTGALTREVGLWPVTWKGRLTFVYSNFRCIIGPRLCPRLML